MGAGHRGEDGRGCSGQQQQWGTRGEGSRAQGLRAATATDRQRVATAFNVYVSTRHMEEQEKGKEDEELTKSARARSRRLEEVEQR